MTQLLKKIFAFLPHPLRVFFIRIVVLLLLTIALPTLFLLNVLSAIFVGALVVVGLLFFIGRVSIRFIKRRTERWLKDYFGVMPKEVKPKLSTEELKTELRVKVDTMLDAFEHIKKPMPTDVRDIAKEMQK